MSKGGRILILRFSALGDVAMTIPVIALLLQSYPDKELVVVSRPFAAKLLEPFKQITFVPIDTKGAHKGIKGLVRLFKTLRGLGPYSFVADLHNVLRTKFLGFLFRLSGIPVYTIDKGRREKAKLVRRNNKQLKPLKSTFQRYSEVFAKGGISIELKPFDIRSLFSLDFSGGIHAAFDISQRRIGVAPFAGHKWKAWPLEKVNLLLEQLNSKGYQIFLFGGRGNEAAKLEELAHSYENVHNLAGQLSMEDELQAMSMLDVMVSMDSANMHLARLVDTPVVSIWGATHPYAGFYGWQLPANLAVQADLSCRPCSVFGNKPCYRGDFACMELITADMVMQRIEVVLNSSGK